MSAIAAHITSLTIVYSTVYPGADQSKHQSDQVQSSFYRKNDADKIHLNTSGREGLARMLQMSLKETVYRCKLENEWQIHVK